MLFTVFWAVFFGASGAVEDDGCRRCAFRGVVECESHDEELRELEASVYCNVAAACEPCGGALFIDCEHCEGGPDNASMEARRAELQAWAAQKHPLEVDLDLDLLRIEDERFEFAGWIRKLKRGRKSVDGHTFFHHVARDCARTEVLIREHYGVDPEQDYRARMRLWFWQLREDHARVMEEHLHSGSTGDYKLLGKDPIFSVCTADEIFGNDYETLRALGVHNAAHMLTSNLYEEVWIGLDGAGWFDAGLAHWYEQTVIGRHRHYCVEEAHGGWKWDEPLWRAETRKYLSRNRDRLLPDMIGQQTGELPDWGHAMSCSVYDWLVATKPDSLKPMLIGLKQRVPARELFRDHVGLDLFAAEDAWRAWVKETYPRREKLGR